ncbi:related to vacuolar protein sorting VACUOLELESS1 [Rhynchosporium agropyri]|uniref:Probable vacuolar protein sorting-associated protein 16 homolog n=1 Tax=Rhynchosporium agropyri TaxID=914238 RepID=A0A1E1L0U8_9HELO|nr:related to vacuolar protein sorting VACUOLELESS1 [Rhynchosporium agropyri]
MANPTAEWERVGGKFYRKIQLYTAIFDQDLELENYHVIGCSYGGAIALFRDETKLQSFRGSQASKSSIDLYSCAGKLIRRINWDKGSIKGLGWSDEERLIVVTADGTVRSYDLQGDFSQFSLGHGSEEYGVTACRFYSTGFVALISNNHLIAVSRYDEPRPKELATPPEGEVHSWTLIAPAYTLSRSVEVLLSIGQTIHVVDATESEDRMLDIGPFTHISVSPSGRFVALYTETGKAYVITSDFQNRLSEHDSKSKIHPKDVQWCGNDAVVIAWEDEVHIIGPNNAAAKYFYDGRVHLITDHDGVRLITNDVCDFLQKVPEVTDEVFRFGTESPASILLDAVEQLENQSPKADDNIQLIRPNLVEAVDACVKAAGHEFSIYWQKQLLKAASFGKSVLDIYNSDEFVDMCETLRVLNAVRYYEIGLPLSYEQFLRLTPEKLVQRLINRREYLLALRISSYLRLPTDRIYVNWASQKVRVGSEDEDTICRLIVEKLAGKRGISFEEIARAAYDEGRGRLATELLNHEPRAGKQVPLLLSMEEDEIALDKAIESGDSDLVFFVLLQLKKKLPLASFFRVINTRPVATSLIESSAQEDDAELLKDLYYQDDRRIDGANVFVREALKQPDSRTVIDKLALAAKLLSDSKENSLELKALQEASTLLKMQEAFDRDLTESFTGLSVNETIFKLIRLGYSSRAKKMQSEFKVPEKTATWLRYEIPSSNFELWSQSATGMNSKNGPKQDDPLSDGRQPFFTLILTAGNPKLASIFIPKAAPSLESGETISMYEKCGMRIKAAEEAVKVKDVEALERLRNAAGAGTVEGREIERLGAGLKR